jgi:3-oxoacyl-[acyl-carrier-protein] synthase-1
MMREGSAICMVGIAGRTCLGASAEASAAAVRGAISGRAEHPFMVDKAGEPMFVARDSLLPADLHGGERLVAIARDPLDQLTTIVDAIGVGDVPCVLGISVPRPGHPSALNDEITRTLQQELEKRRSQRLSEIFPHGHTSGLLAMNSAITKIQRQEHEFCVAGAVDSYLQPETLEWLDERGKLMSEVNRSGFTPGEGAGFCLMTAERTARKYRLPILCRITGIGIAWEKNAIDSEEPGVGVGMSAAISEACQSLDLAAEKIDFTYCDMNGERYRSEEFTFAALRKQRLFAEVTDNLTPADCWGDVGAASGPLFAALAIASAERGYAKGPRALLWTSADSGHRAAAALSLALKEKED